MDILKQRMLLFFENGLGDKASISIQIELGIFEIIDFLDDEIVDIEAQAIFEEDKYFVIV